jgi:hypothetical protein
MSARSRNSLAVVALAAALVAAGPVEAGGPLQPPDVGLLGFDIRYRIPPFFLDTTNPGQCLRVTCWSPSHDDVAVNFELWDAGTDPNRAAIFGAGVFLDFTNVAAVNLCPPSRSHPAVGRITASPIKKLSLECSAETVDPASLRTISTLPLVVPPKKKKKR